MKKRQSRPPRKFTLEIDRTNYDEDPENQVVHKSKGVRSKLGICHFVAELLKVNEQLPACRKMTDEDLRRVIINEFPHRLSMQRSSVRRLYERKIGVWYYRNLYNVGHLTGKVPKVRSKPFDQKGQPIQNVRLRSMHPAKTVGQLLEEKRWGAIGKVTVPGE